MINIRLKDSTIIQEHGNLAVFPLFSDQAGSLPHMLLADALSKDLIDVLEVGSGSVPTLLVRNRAPAPVLILDGEQLTGARQTRMAARSVIVGGRAKTNIPVSCVEQGRWRFTSEKFSAGSHYSPTRVRKKVKNHEKYMARAGANPTVSDLAFSQSDVWSEIQDVQDSLHVHSPTGSLDEVSRSVEDSVVDWVEKLPLQEQQIGVLAFMDGRPLALDVIGSDELYGMVHTRLMRGYVMDALSSRRRSSQAYSVTPGMADEFLGLISQCTPREAPTVGIGSYYVLSGGVTGGRLEQDVDGVNRVIHLNVFPDDRDSNGRARDDHDGDPEIRGPSRRSRGSREPSGGWTY